MAAWLGNPTRDPHGDPIPSIEGHLPDDATQPLDTLPVGKTGAVVRVLVQDADRLRYLASLGLVPGAHVEVEAREPFDGTLTVRVDEARHVLDGRLAKTIVVEDVH